jgi:pimeloyl-ACP methyl ester carboxylesterase
VGRVNERAAETSGPPPRRRRRRLLVGAGIAVLASAAAVAAQRAVARRLRARDDPEAGTPLGELPPQDLGRARAADGTEIAVRAAGPEGAPTLVFAHGFSLDMTTWYHQWGTFSDRYRCILLDHRAHGRSGTPASGDYSILTMGQDVKAVLDAHVPEGPAVLIGHSMGAMAVLSFAQTHPGDLGRRVAAVVLVDTVVSDVLKEILGGLGARAGWALRQLGRQAAARPEAMERLRRWIRRWGADTAFLVAWATNFGPGASPSQVEYVTRLAQDAPVEVWIHTAQDLLDIDFREALGHVTVPALVVVGDRDLITPKPAAQAIRAALPRGRAVVITGAGHISMLEQHRVFNEVLEDFLADVLPARAQPRASAGR